MAKNKKKKKGGYTPPPQSTQMKIDEITTVAEQILASKDPGSLWGKLHKAFLKSPVDSATAAKIIMHKDLDELRRVISQLNSGSEVVINETKEEELPYLEHDQIVEALRVFRKRIKFMKLDHESKLGVGPLSGGKELKFDSIMAPHDYPMGVWKALAHDGHLIDDGGGFFRLP